MSAPDDVWRTSISSDRLPQDHALWRTFSNPSRSDTNISRTSTFETVLHMSCQKCHHWHDRVPILLSRNANQHFRIRCTKCHGQLFGIGGNSTQTTLVSQQTDLDGPEEKQFSQRVGPTCSNQAAILPLVSRATVLGSLSSISERPPTLDAVPNNCNPRQLSGSRPSSREGHTLSVAGGESFNTKRRGSNGITRSHFSENGHNVTSFIDKRFGVLRRAAKRLLRRIRKADFRISKPASTEKAIGDSGQINIRSAGAHDKALPTAADHSTANHGSQSHDAPKASPSMNRGAETPNEQANALPQSRIAIMRREKTLQKLALQRATCKCDTNCHCMHSHGQNTAVPSTHPSSEIDDGHQRRSSAVSLKTDDVPQHALYAISSTNTQGSAAARAHTYRQRRHYSDPLSQILDMIPADANAPPPPPSPSHSPIRSLNFLGIGGHFDFDDDDLAAQPQPQPRWSSSNNFDRSSSGLGLRLWSWGPSRRPASSATFATSFSSQAPTVVSRGTASSSSVGEMRRRALRRAETLAALDLADGGGIIAEDGGNVDEDRDEADDDVDDEDERDASRLTWSSQ
ncbi:MAG: hypothetical protein M1819_006290 [Sarea resinae]|nr:MAG: hypothetical protein M1819_006290 [Sarea resinae]